MVDFLQKACSFCAYQERTQDEVRARLKTWGADREETEEIIAWLITENFLNESRFARQFAGGKFRIKKWGKKKIVYELKSRGISPRCITEAMDEIGAEEYALTLKELALKKEAALSSEKDPFLRRKKITTYLLGKGYDPEDIRKTLEIL